MQVDVIFSIKGRMRLGVSESPNKPMKMLKALKKFKEINRAEYNTITKTFVIEYDQEDSNIEKIILNFCGLYSQDKGVTKISLNYKLSKTSSIGYSSLISLAMILVDMGSYTVAHVGKGAGMAHGLAYGRARKAMRWFSVGSTMGAIFEHGYNELKQNGAFDPEVMSIMYLFNTMNDITDDKMNYSPLIAWSLTYGRHILTRKNKSIIISTVKIGDEIKVVKENDKSTFFNQFMTSCLDVYQNVNMKKSIGRN